MSAHMNSIGPDRGAGRLRKSLRGRRFDRKAVDFYSLRHTCGAWLAGAGVHPKVIHRIMRYCRSRSQ
jgi:integrase